MCGKKKGAKRRACGAGSPAYARKGVEGRAGGLADFGDFLAAAVREVLFPLADRQLLEVVYRRI